MTAMTEPSVDTARNQCSRHTNCLRWGPEDQHGTLNQLRPERVVDAAMAVRAVRAGRRVISIGMPWIHTRRVIALSGPGGPSA